MTTQQAKSILDTANALSNIQKATISNADGAKRIQDIIDALDGLDESQIKATLSLSNLSVEDKKAILVKKEMASAMLMDELATNADTISKYENLKITNLLKVAWAKFSAFAKANPYLLIAAGAIAATVAIYKYSKADEKALENS